MHFFSQQEPYFEDYSAVLLLAIVELLNIILFDCANIFSKYL